MRLDKLISDCGVATRKEAASAVRAGQATVNGNVVREPDRKVDPGLDVVVFRGIPLVYRRFVYVMLNKPTGYVSATDDRSLPYVLELLPPEYRKRGLFPVGRLDRDTTGLFVMTDDGQTAHRALSPRRHVEKVYSFTCIAPLPLDAEAAFADGITLGDETCKPALLNPASDRRSGTVTLTEGKYHQIKRMFERLGNKITSLKRETFAGIALDPALAPGEWRELTERETETLLSAAGTDKPE
ncbi:MAG: rRNA pseudouridine synthase [Clostridia bacterium]|nr:rRNA pseudouridine synthase [Clostridia bacterium]